VSREIKAQGDVGTADPGNDAFKKRDQLGLSNHPKGCTYSKEQRQRIIQEVSKLLAQGLSKLKTLKVLGVCRSTYYGWLKADRSCSQATSVLHATDSEHQAIIEKKKAAPHMSHRQISGSLRHEGYWISPSSCYRALKSLHWILSPLLRQTPWKVPRVMSPFGQIKYGEKTGLL